LKVFELKENQIILKNTGLYKVQFNFSMKKKITREYFTVEPMDGTLEPGAEKTISCKFKATKETKMKTNNSTTDLVCEILEGQTLELFKPVPININVNAEYSKYSIAPLKSINFGPICFNETKTRNIEIKNEGIFEFNYTIFDYNNE